jgi:hypothetical protein
MLLVKCNRITIAIFVSFTARGLSSIRSQIFCYTAISSAGIIGILPGYLIRMLSFSLLTWLYTHFVYS